MMLAMVWILMNYAWMDNDVSVLKMFGGTYGNGPLDFAPVWGDK